MLSKTWTVYLNSEVSNVGENFHHFNHHALEWHSLVELGISDWREF